MTGMYLEHYGVLGMKWGVRKNPDKAYTKASAKLKKLDAKLVKARDRQHRLETKTKKKQASAVTKLSYADTKRKQDNAMKSIRKAAKAQARANKATAKADRRLKKALKWHARMESTFKDVKLTNIRQEDVELGERYIQMKFQRRRQ